MKNTKVNMVDLMGQYTKIKKEVDANIISTIESGRFVNGPILQRLKQLQFLELKLFFVMLI